MFTLMIQGTGSNVGKSVFVAGLCRILANKGINVYPFKPQNMSNNAAVTIDRGEIGRAQALQAIAARVPATVHLNPILIKPQSDLGSQVVVQGQIYCKTNAKEFQALKPALMDAVSDSYSNLKNLADCIIVEGAGSAAEINLRYNDIANMGFARKFNIPVVLLADIDRGGVIAQVAGTRAVLDPNDAALVIGFVVNKFRGDPDLFTEGMRLIEFHSRWESLGLLPFFHDAAMLPQEDLFALQQELQKPKNNAKVNVAVPLLPYASNIDDLDPLKNEPNCNLIMMSPGMALPVDTDLVILPGSKSVISDCAFLKNAGWNHDIIAHRRRGGRVLGICGGYQMLGQSIVDKAGIEGAQGQIAGLGLLNVETVITPHKTLKLVTGIAGQNIKIQGYKMHMGNTYGPDCLRPMLRIGSESDADNLIDDGAMSGDGIVSGTYVHGLFANDDYRGALLEGVGGKSGVFYNQHIDRILDALAGHMETHLNLRKMFPGLLESKPSPKNKTSHGST